MLMTEVPGKRPRERPKWRYSILVREDTKLVGEKKIQRTGGNGEGCGEPLKKKPKEEEDMWIQFYSNILLITLKMSNFSTIVMIHFVDFRRC